jgi:hypothetical protein
VGVIAGNGAHRDVPSLSGLSPHAGLVLLPRLYPVRRRSDGEPRLTGRGFPVVREGKAIPSHLAHRGPTVASVQPSASAEPI